MLRVFYSNRTERLLSEFVSDVSDWRARVGPFEPVHVVVPNSNVETWLRFGLAQKTGIAAHLDVRYLRSFVNDLAKRSGLSVVDGALLRGMLLAVLLDDVVDSRPELAPVRAYVAGGGGAEASDLRRLQLASRLSRLFEEYSLSRPEMLAQWRERCVLGGTPFAETEKWQRALWMEVFGPHGRLTRRREEAPAVEYTLPGELARKLAAGAVTLPGRVHVFGVSYVARVFQDVFAALGRASDLRIYTLNPCREFWEDVEHARAGLILPGRGERLGAEALESEDPFGLELPGDTPALRLWGRPGRENVRLLNELTDSDFDAAFDDPLGDGPTLLRAVQQDILDRAEERRPSPESAPGLVSDGSIQFLACPGIRREAEIIAGEIWKLVKESEARGDEPRLRFNDIAVVVNTSEKEAYFTHLTAAFAENHDIPCNVVDRSFAGSSRVGEAVELLLDLPLGHFTRTEVLRLATHPCVGGALEDAGVEQWPAWAEALGIAHGAERTDHAETYIEGDLFNWDQGLRRLALGTFVSGPLSGDESPVELESGSYLPLDVPTSQSASVGRFAALIRSLIADARFARSAKLTMPEWADFFGALLSSYITAAEADLRELGACRRLLADLADVDVDGARVSYRIAAGLVKEAFSGMGGGSGQYLADGVVLSTCQPMRALPFRAVFMAGLGEGKFPASDRRDPLDLRRARPRAGDVNAQQQDRYLFLETLLCARERLYLSWVSRDPLTGDSLEPSSVVSELDSMLRGYLSKVEHERLRIDHRLRRYDPEYFPDLFSGDSEAVRTHEPAPVPAPEARREAAALALRRSREASGGSGTGGTWDWEAVAARLEAHSRERLREWLRIPAVSERTTDQELPAVIDVSLSDLTRFLQCPLQGWAQSRLRLSDEEEADEVVEDEPFETPRIEVRRFLEPILLDALFSGEASTEGLSRRYDEANALRTLSSKAPVGVFGEADRETHLSILESWKERLTECDPPCPQRMPLRVAVGRASEFGALNRLHPALELKDVAIRHGSEWVRRTVRIHGTLLPLVESGSVRGSLIVEAKSLKGADASIVLWQKRLRGVLEHALLSALGHEAKTHRVWTCGAAAGKNEFKALELETFTEEEAREWLSALASDLLSGSHAYLLPYEAVLLSRWKSVPMAAAIAAYVGDGEVRASTRFGPLTRFDGLAPLPESDVERVIERRFGPIFSRVQGGEQ